jgi:hypothetical protein
MIDGLNEVDEAVVSAASARAGVLTGGSKRQGSTGGRDAADPEPAILRALIRQYEAQIKEARRNLQAFRYIQIVLGVLALGVVAFLVVKLIGSGAAVDAKVIAAGGVIFSTGAGLWIETPIKEMKRDLVSRNKALERLIKLAGG